MRGLDYRRFEDAGWLSRLGLAGKAAEILLHGGSYRTGYLHRWISAQLAECGVHTWADLKHTDPGADPGLPEDQRYKLVVIVSDLSRGRMLRLPWDYPHLCDLNPDHIPVADAVVASAAIPFFFRAQHLRCGPAQGGQTLTLTDGGSLSCYPIDVFDRHDSTPSRWPTLGIKLSARRTPTTEWAPITTPIQMLTRLFQTMSSAHDTLYVDQPSVQQRTIFIDTTGISATDFNLNPTTRDHLFHNGQHATTQFLTTWNWTNWQHTYEKRTAASGGR
jgi:NTE family protein